MATITPYMTAAGKRYRVRYRKPDKTQTDKRGFKTKKQAEIFAASVTVSKATGEYIDPALGKITVGQLAPGWLAAKKAVLKPSTFRPMESTWRAHVEDTWAHRTVSSIQHSEVQDWAGELSVEKSRSTVSRAVGVLGGILDAAVADRRIRKNPARGVKITKRRRHRRVYLTHEQVHTLAALTPHPDLVLTLAYTGLRWGEATALRVRNLNEVRRRLSVEENAVLSGGAIHAGTPKGHERRTVPYVSFLGPRFAELKKGKGGEALLFGNGTDHVRLPHAVSGWFTKAVKAAQANDASFPTVTPHGLRHTAASFAVASGANVKVVQRMLGDKSAAMTLDTYADLFDGDLDEVAERMEKDVRDAGKGTAWGRNLGA